MQTPNLVLYGMNRLGPYHVLDHIDEVRASGFTTIIMGMLHIGNPVVKSTTQLGDIIFNGDEPLVIRDGERPFPLVTGDPHFACMAWPGRIAALKGGTTSVTQIFASVGGGGAGVNRVRDFETIQTIYEANGKTFANSVLERNFKALRYLFPAIDGIDMDCEDTYDPASFVAFCEMLIGLGFELTFCPYWGPSFWANALFEIEQKHPMQVKWWNLQCYDGGRSNNPDTWAAAVGSVFGQPPAKDYIIPGRAARFWDGGWQGECPSQIAQDFAAWPKAALAGGFIWDMDAIIDAAHRTENEQPCPGDPTPITLAGYAAALKKGLGV